MQKNLKSEIVQRIQEAVGEFKITSYEIAKNTSLSELGISKILSGKVANPNESSIKTIALCLTTNFGVNEEWIYTGAGNLKSVKIPLPKEFDELTVTQKNRKLDEVAIFVAHNEKELMKNPIFKSIVEKIGYQLVIKTLMEEGEHQEKEF